MHIRLTVLYTFSMVLARRIQLSELVLSVALSFILVTELGGCLSQGRWVNIHLPTSRNDNRVLSLSFEKMFLPEDEYTNIDVDIIYKPNLASFHH